MHSTTINNQSTKKHSLLLISLIILIIALFFSDFTTYSNYIILPIMALWAPFMIGNNTLTKPERTFVRVSVALLFIIVFYSMSGYSSMGRNPLLRNVSWMIVGMMSIYAMRLFSDFEKKVLFVVLTITIVLLLISFIREGQSIAAFGDKEDASMTAGTLYGSMFMLLSGISLIALLKIKAWLPRVVSLMILLLTLYLNVAILQRGTNVIFTVAELLLIILFNVKNRVFVGVTSVAVLVMFFVFVSSDLLIDLFDWLASVSSSQRLADRFNQISLALTYEDIESGGGSFAARHELIMISWNTFTSSIGHFIFGAGEHWMTIDIIGHHSFIVDTLARYGLIGGILLFIYYKKQYQIMFSIINKKTEWALYMQCAVVFLFYLLRNFYGNVSAATVAVIMLIYFPLVLTFIINHKI